MNRLKSFFLILVLPLMALVFFSPASLPWPQNVAEAMELCGERSKDLMLSVGITKRKIRLLCEKVAQSTALFTLKIKRMENQMGYCRVTLVLSNNSTEHLDTLVLASEKSRFELFRFDNIFPGDTGYAAASSRILLACDELEQFKLTFRWPPAFRIGGKAPRASVIRRYKPYLLDSILAWNP